MASVFDKYPNLPGFMTEFRDGGLTVRQEQTPPGTDSVLLLGTAVDGIIGEPVAVDPNMVETVFGGSTNPNGTSNGATLVKAFWEAWQAGCRDIRLMRITGSTAKAKLKGEQLSRSIQTPQADFLGLVPGNNETVFTLDQNVINTASVIVTADGYDVSSTNFTVTNGEAGIDPAPGIKAKVTLAEGSVAAGASIYITYTYADKDLNQVEVVQNGTTDVNGDFQLWYAPGQDATFPLSTTAKAGTVHIYADGVELPSEAVTLLPSEGESKNEVTIKAGYGDLGAQLEATYIHEEVVTEEAVMEFQSIFGGAVYNQTKIHVEEILDTLGSKIGVRIKIEKPESKKAQVAESPLEFTSIDYPEFNLLVEAINSHFDNNIVRAVVNKRFELVDTRKITPGVISFTGGTDGLAPSKQEIFEILGGRRNGAGQLEKEGVYQLLENYTVDTIVPLGVYADDVLAGKYDNFASQLALACAVVSHRNSTTIGVIATSSPDDAGLASVQAHVTKLLSRKNDYFMRDRAGNILKDSEGHNIDLGRFISVIAGPDLVIRNTASQLGTYTDNTPSGYAGFVSQLDPQSAPTNKILPFAAGLRYSFSNSQLDKLTQARYVTFKTKNNGANVAVTDAPTAAQATSDYRRLSTTRVVKEVVNELRAVCDPYIGEPNEVPQRNAMSAAISKRLDALVGAGVIMDFDFVIIATPQMQLMGEANIELTLVPPMELRRITTIVNLTPAI